MNFSITLALKMISKFKVVQNRQQSYVIREKDILKSLNCKFCLKVS